MIDACIDRCSFSAWRELMKDRSEKYESICCIGVFVEKENICVFFYLLCVWFHHMYHYDFPDFVDK